MKYREFIVVAKGGHETVMAKAPRAVTLDYARKVAYHWAEAVDHEDEETETLVYRRMRPEECAYVYPWSRGNETYRREYDGQLVRCYLPYMEVLGGIERGLNTPRKLGESYNGGMREYALYCNIFHELRDNGFITYDRKEQVYKFNY